MHYSASKAGVIGLTRSLARELGPKGITVNTIPPSFVDTPALRGAEEAGYLGEGVPFHEQSTPVRRVGRPEDIAAACAFLVRDDASYVTGQVIGVNGGASPEVRRRRGGRGGGSCRTADFGTASMKVSRRICL